MSAQQSTIPNVHFGDQNYVSPNLSNNVQSKITIGSDETSGIVNNNSNGIQGNNDDETSQNNPIDNTFVSEDYLPNHW